jgi:hypothetical protein
VHAEVILEIAEHDQAFGHQRLQRGADAGAADAEPIDQVALDEVSPGREAQQEHGLPQSLRAPACPGVLSRFYVRSYTTRMTPDGDGER